MFVQPIHNLNIGSRNVILNQAGCFIFSPYFGKKLLFSLELRYLSLYDGTVLVRGCRYIWYFDLRFRYRFTNNQVKRNHGCIFTKPTGFRNLAEQLCYQLGVLTKYRITNTTTSLAQGLK